VAVGKADWIKGHDVFFEAAALLHRRIGSARFALVGSPSNDYSPVLDRIITAAGLSDAVLMTGHRSDAVDIMAAADLVVLPSRSESLSQVAMEAMAVGTPVIASRVGGLPEVVSGGETGLLVEPGDVVGLAAAMESVLLDRDMASRLASAGRRRAAEEFTAPIMTRRTLAVYEWAMTR